MRALVYDEPKVFSVKEIETPEPGENEIRVKVEKVGVCGTDIHLHNGTFIGKYPLIPGHEMVGMIEKLGPGVNDDVTDFWVGQQVTINGNFGCGICRPCKEGKPLYCKMLTCLGCNGDGAFAEYMVVHKKLVFDAEGLPADMVVFTEPLACSVHGMNVLRPGVGSDILLIGAGSTGAMLAQLLIHGGAGNLTVAASKDFKLRLFREYGVNDTLSIDRDDAGKSAGIMQKHRPEGYDIVIDATGVPALQEKCTSLVKTGGVVFFYGVGRKDEPIHLNAYDVFERELTIKGSFAQVNSFGDALHMLRSGRIQTDGLITHQYPLEQWQQAMDAHASDPLVHKIVLKP